MWRPSFEIYSKMDQSFGAVLPVAIVFAYIHLNTVLEDI